MKTIIRLILILAIIFTLGGLLGFISAKYDINLEFINALRFPIYIVVLVSIVYTLMNVFKVAITANKFLDKIMTESLSIALDSEDSPLFAEIYATLMRFDKNSYITPCFLGLTNTRLLMVVANRMFVPEHVFGFDLTQIKYCKIRKTLMQNQYILVLCYDENYIKIRISLHINNLKNQESNALFLMNELRKCT